jgi:DNA-binding transcriptional LysR family regulator
MTCQVRSFVRFEFQDHMAITAIAGGTAFKKPTCKTVKRFEQAKLMPRIAEIADEKQMIVNLVAARLGAAILPRWTSRMTISGARFVPL